MKADIAQALAKIEGEDPQLWSVLWSYHERITLSETTLGVIKRDLRLIGAGLGICCAFIGPLIAHFWK